MKICGFWDVMLHGLPYSTEFFRGICCLCVQDRRKDSSKTLVPTCQTTWHHIPENHNIDTQYRGKLTSDMSSLFSAIWFPTTITNDLW